MISYHLSHHWVTVAVINCYCAYVIVLMLKIGSSWKQRFMMTGLMKEMNTETYADEGDLTAPKYEDRLTPAERRYLERWQQLEAKRLLKNASASHRDRIQKFNQYLANLSEHYDIPKVGPG